MEPIVELAWVPRTASAVVSTREGRADWSHLLSRANFGHERIVITRNGRPAGLPAC
ncbi:type II toxin-antitoxin system prevent-host-death family antitoxin [Sediminihabitans luteus]|uniref:type II toxin-antitoxin system prevent-host-death family antitoxin n=1 Tax=Sediminihabitans luteus TaxID=1138585 RepID=UPI0012FD2DCF|nr:type II toxin-antitoxin system prevent-host-death family antitoxin [Sediminihabitans luteus]